jgi:hypothetical protein
MLLAICGACICCSYCQLEERYRILKSQLGSQMKAVGLPEEYEYDEDNIYMMERIEEERRANLSYRAR